MISFHLAHLNKQPLTSCEVSIKLIFVFLSFPLVGYTTRRESFLASSPFGKGGLRGIFWISLFSIKSPLTPLFQRGVQKDSGQARMTEVRPVASCEVSNTETTIFVILRLDRRIQKIRNWIPHQVRNDIFIYEHVLLCLYYYNPEAELRGILWLKIKVKFHHKKKTLFHQRNFRKNNS